MQKSEHSDGKVFLRDAKRTSINITTGECFFCIFITYVCNVLSIQISSIYMS